MARVVIGRLGPNGQVHSAPRSAPRSPPAPHALTHGDEVLGGGEQIMGYQDGYPIVLRRPRGRYVMDGSGAVRFEHDLGPKAAEAATSLREGVDALRDGLKEIRTTIQDLRKPAARTALTVAGVVGVGIVVASIVYLIAQREKSKKKKKNRD